MPLEPIRSPGPVSLAFPQDASSLLLLLGYMAWLGWTLWHGRDAFLKLTMRSRVVLLVLWVAVVPLHRFLSVKLTNAVIVPPGPVTTLPLVSALSLPGMALIGIIAYVYGPVPGLVAGLMGSLAWSRYARLLATDWLALATWGYFIGVLLHQRYRGPLFRFIRTPIIACFLASLATVLQLSVIRLLAAAPANSLLLIDYIVVLWRNQLPDWLVVGVGLGAVAELVLVVRPEWRRRVREETPSIYSRSLSVQFMVFVVPLVLLMVFSSALAVTSRSVTLARERAEEQMARSAAIANDSILQFYLTGRSLIETFAQEPQLTSLDLQQRLGTLDITLRVTPYFRQMLLVEYAGGNFQIPAAMPLGAEQTGLTGDEIEALRALEALKLGSQETPISEFPIEGLEKGKGYSIVTHVNPGGAPGGVTSGLYLVGRAMIQGQLNLGATLSALQGVGIAQSVANYNPWASDLATGEAVEHAAGVDSYAYRGYVTDATGWVVMGTQPDSEPSRLVLETVEGPASESVVKEGMQTAWTRQGEQVLRYVRKVESIPLYVVLELPYVEVLATAADTARSMVLVQVFFGLTLLVLIPVLSNRVTRPLNTLARAADRIAHGDLKGEIAIAGDDEVSQLGDALDQMRVRLQERLNDLSLLLDISGKVSATLNLERGIGPILDGALVETSGVVARFITLNETGKQAQLFTSGHVAGDLVQLDRALTSAVARRDDPLVLSDLGNAYRQVPGGTQLRSVAAIPVRLQGSTVAVFWVGAEHLDAFDEARVNFLTTLAGQAAVLIENARLFQTAEGGRQRLAAILSSTRDAILVVDAEGHLVLTNPAAQRLFEVEREAVGQPVTHLKLPEPLVAALATQTTTARRMRRYQLALPKSLRSSMTGKEETESLAPVEVPFEDGRTFYASMAPITSDEGVMVGTVVVLRDVTHFKELNEMKSEFVATVSHDLRAPLTFMRGYTTMLSMVGDLNDRQRDYMQRILDGIEQMNGLVGDLLDLRRVEAGVGIRQEPCRLGLIMVEAVEAMRARATSKGVDLRMEPSEGSPMVVGDRTLLRQSISNLVDNAVKYTPSGGEVVVGLDITEDTAIVRVSDTGIGIAPADQVRLFEKFYRIKRRETGTIQGTGLGLALVKSIVERHGGHVGVESTLNQGSTFFIQLPLPAEDITLSPAAQRQDQSGD